MPRISVTRIEIPRLVVGVPGLLLPLDGSGTGRTSSASCRFLVCRLASDISGFLVPPQRGQNLCLLNLGRSRIRLKVWSPAEPRSAPSPVTRPELAWLTRYRVVASSGIAISTIATRAPTTTGIRHRHSSGCFGAAAASDGGLRKDAGLGRHPPPASDPTTPAVNMKNITGSTVISQAQSIPAPTAKAAMPALRGRRSGSAAFVEAPPEREGDGDPQRPEDEGKDEQQAERSHLRVALRGRCCGRPARTAYPCLRGRPEVLEGPRDRFRSASPTSRHQPPPSSSGTSHRWQVAEAVHGVTRGRRLFELGPAVAGETARQGHESTRTARQCRHDPGVCGTVQARLRGSSKPLGRRPRN